MKTKHLHLFLVSIAFPDLTASVHAAVWSGASSSAWADGANWGGTAPVAMDPLEFTGVTNTATVNDITGLTVFGPVTFDNSATGGAFVLSGNGIVLGGGITTIGGTGSPVHQIDLELQLNGSRTILTDLANDLLVNGVISETGGTRNLAKTGLGTLTLAGSNTYSGTTTLTAGQLVVGSDDALGSGPISFNGGTLQADNAARTLGNPWSASSNGGTIAGASALTLTGAGTLTASSALVFANSGLATVSGPFSITNSATGRTLTLSGAGEALWSGTLTDGVASGGASNTGEGKIVMKGSGVVTLAGDNNYSGTTTLDATHTGTVIISGTNTTTGYTSVVGGSLGIGKDSALGTGPLLIGSASGVVSSSVFASAGPRSIANNVSITTASGATPAITGTHALTFNGVVTVTGGNRTLTVNNSGGTTLAGRVFLSNSGTNGRTFTINGTGALIISGQVADFDGAGVAGKLVYDGSGMLTLGAANIHTGSTTLTSGAVAVGNDNALGSGAVIFNGGSLQASGAPRVVSNAFLVAGNGGAFGGTNALTLAGNGNQTASSTLTFNGPAVTNFSGIFSITNNGAGRQLTLDGSGNSFWSGSLTDGTGSPGIPSGNSGTGSLIKTGAGTATFAGNNTYSGATDVNAGTLVLAAGSSASTIHVHSGAFLGFSVGSSITSTAAVNLAVGSAIRISGTPTLPSHILMTAASVTGNPVLATPVPGYRITTDGTTISLTSTGGGGNFGTWATANGIPGESASEDFDKDGLSNLVEYALGTNPTTSTQTPGTFANRIVTFTKGADAIANRDVALAIEESDDLGGSDPWTVVATLSAADASPTISHTLPTDKTRVFARLRVTQLP